MPCLFHCYGNAVGEGLTVEDGTGVLLGGGKVLVGITVAVKGNAVSVSGSVGCGVIVLPGNGEGTGVRVGELGTQIISPACK